MDTTRLFCVVFVLISSTFGLPAPVPKTSSQSTLPLCPPFTMTADNQNSMCFVSCEVNNDCGSDQFVCCKTDCGTHCVKETILDRYKSQEVDESDTQKELEDIKAQLNEKLDQLKIQLEAYKAASKVENSGEDVPNRPPTEEAIAIELSASDSSSEEEVVTDANNDEEVQDERQDVEEDVDDGTDSNENKNKKEELIYVLGKMLEMYRETDAPDSDTEALQESREDEDAAVEEDESDEETDDDLRDPEVRRKLFKEVQRMLDLEDTGASDDRDIDRKSVYPLGIGADMVVRDNEGQVDGYFVDAERGLVLLDGENIVIGSPERLDEKEMKESGNDGQISKDFQLAEDMLEEDMLIINQLGISVDDLVKDLREKEKTLHMQNQENASDQSGAAIQARSISRTFPEADEHKSLMMR